MKETGKINYVEMPSTDLGRQRHSLLRFLAGRLSIIGTEYVAIKNAD